MEESNSDIRFEPIPEDSPQEDLGLINLEPKPAEPKEGIDEKGRVQSRGFEKKVWNVAGVIKQSRLLEGHILALVHISKELKTLTSDAEEKILCVDRHAKNFKRDGLYLVLETCEGLSFFGGGHADKMNSTALDIAYRHIQKIREFFMFTMEIEDAVNAQEEYKEDLRGKILSKKGG